MTAGPDAGPGNEPTLHDLVKQQLIDLAHAWDRAMLTNDPAAIGRYMADGWTIIGPEGRVSDKGTFLQLVSSGALTHDVMESHDVDVRVYGEAAVVIARGVSGGTYQGHAFRETERATCVFIRQDGVWKCVLTHLSRISPDSGP